MWIFSKTFGLLETVLYTISTWLGYRLTPQINWHLFLFLLEFELVNNIGRIISFCCDEEEDEDEEEDLDDDCLCL